MDWWTEVRLALSTFLDMHGLLAGFVLLLIEEAGLPIPVPGDVVMLLLGMQARQGKIDLLRAILVMEAATMLGASALYTIAAWAGRGLAYRYGRFMRLEPDRLDRAERWLQAHGTKAVFVGRLVPGLRIATVVACGVFQVPFWRFLPAMSLGALAYILLYTLAGYLAGPAILALLERLHLPLGLVGSLLLLLVTLVWVARARSDLRRRAALVPEERVRAHLLRAGALAGALATIGSTLLLNVVVNLLGSVVFQAPGTLIERTAARLALALARDVDPLLLIAVVPGYLIVGMLWGAVYAGWVEERLPFPDWANGALFSLLPLAVSLGLVMPLLGVGFLGLAAGPIVLLGETVRHLAFGALLGLIYPALRARHLVRVLPHSTDDLAAAEPERPALPAEGT